jgi:hypothetical protein
MAFDWGKFLSGASKVALEVGVAYASYKVVEQQVDYLLMLPPEEAGMQLISAVPRMNDDSYNAFFQVLSMKARTYDYAQALLNLTSYIRNASGNVAQLLSEPVSEASDILTGMMMRQEPWARMIYAHLLQLYGQLDGTPGMKAQAIYGRLAAANILPG